VALILKSHGIFFGMKKQSIIRADVGKENRKRKFSLFEILLCRKPLLVSLQHLRTAIWVRASHHCAVGHLAIVGVKRFWGTHHQHVYKNKKA